MRILTPSEQREIEAIKNKILSGDITGIDFYGGDDNLIVDFSLNKVENKEMWLNILEIVLSTQEAMKTEWYRRGNNKIDAIQAVEYKRDDNE